MSTSLDELERLVGLLIAEQKRHADLFARQRAAMISLNADETARIVAEQEQARTRLSAIENRRKALSLQIARELRVALPPETLPTLSQLAGAIPDLKRRQRLLSMRDELRGLVEQVSSASHVAGRLAGTMLGHLNSAIRLLSAAMNDAGTYTRNGAPRISTAGPARMGVVEAVG